MIGRTPPDTVHGTTNGYTYWRCRCVACTDAGRQYASARRRDIIGRTPPDTVHGTTNGYDSWRCRCEPCKDARRAYNAARKLRQQ